MLITSSKPIYLFIHVCMIGNYLEILNSFQQKLIELNMHHFFQKIYLGILGKSDSLEIQRILDIFKDLSCIELLEHNENVHLYERLTLNKLYTKSLSEDFYVLYLHTKGVTHRPTEYGIHVWRNKMLFFLLQYSTLCLHQFEHNLGDVVGIDLLNESPMKYPLHYSGNFWWTTSSHISKLPFPIDNGYLEPEMWICKKKDGRYISIYQTFKYNFYQGINIKNKDNIIREYTSNCLHSNFLKPIPIELYLEDLLSSKNHMFGNFPNWVCFQKTFQTGVYKINQEFFNIKDDPYYGKIKFWVFQDEQGRLSSYIEGQEIVIRSKGTISLEFDKISELVCYGTKQYQRNGLVYTPNIPFTVENKLFNDDPNIGKLKTLSFDYDGRDEPYILVENQKIIIHDNNGRRL